MVERVEQARAYVLHQRPYRETSLLLEVFSREYGRVGLVANGARRPKSRLRGVLQPLQESLLSWQLRGELGGLRQAESYGSNPRLLGDGLYAGFYMNELLMRLSARSDPHVDLYDSYHAALQTLSAGQEPGVVLRLFERDLLEAIGYGLELAFESETGAPVEPSGHYVFDPLSGVSRAMQSANAVTITGAALLGLQSGDLQDPALRKQAKWVLQVALNHLLDHRPLKTVQMIRQMRLSNAAAQRNSHNYSAEPDASP